MNSIAVNNLDDLFDSSPNTVLSLNLSSKSIGLQEANQIAALLNGRKVSTLTLSHSNISTNALIVIAKALETVNNAITVYLDDNKIDDVGAVALAESLKNKKIKTLSLKQNAIGDKGAKALAEGLAVNKQAALSLQNNQIGPKGAEALVKAWAAHSTTYSVDLSKNKLGDEGAECVAKVLKNDSGKITDLYLRHNDIGAKGDLALAQNLPSQIKNVVYRVEKLSFSEYHERHPVATNILTLISMLCFPLLFALPFVEFEEDVRGLINPRVN